MIMTCAMPPFNDIPKRVRTVICPNHIHQLWLSTFCSLEQRDGYSFTLQCCARARVAGTWSESWKWIHCSLPGGPLGCHSCASSGMFQTIVLVALLNSPSLLLSLDQIFWNMLQATPKMCEYLHTHFCLAL